MLEAKGAEHSKKSDWTIGRVSGAETLAHGRATWLEARTLVDGFFWGDECKLPAMLLIVFGIGPGADFQTRPRKILGRCRIPASLWMFPL